MFAIVLYLLKIRPQSFHHHECCRYGHVVFRTTAAVLVLLSLAACTAAKPSVAPTVTIPATTPAPTTAAATTTTATVQPITAPPPTTPVATTTAPTTIATKTAPPTELDALKETIKQAALDGFDSTEACVVAPEKCDVNRITPIQGTARFILSANIKKLIAAGQRGRRNLEDPSHLSVTSVVVGADQQRAVVLSCWWDTGIIYVPNGNPDGSDKLVDATKSSYEERYSMVLEDGQWLVELDEHLSVHPEVNTCVSK